MSILKIFSEIQEEIKRAEAKHGVQDFQPIRARKRLISHVNSEDMKQIVDAKMRDKTITHDWIIAEEFFEAIEESNGSPALRKELVQLACAVVKAIKAFDAQEQKRNDGRAIEAAENQGL